MSNGWQSLDKKIIERLRKRNESTTSAGVGGYTVPLGGEPLRPIPPYQNVKKRKKAKARLREMLDLDDN